MGKTYKDKEKFYKNTKPKHANMRAKQKEEKDYSTEY